MKKVILIVCLLIAALSLSGCLTPGESCFNETYAKLEEMRTKVETVVDERNPQKITFILNTCFEPKDEKIKIQDYEEPALCAEYCGTTKNVCTLLQYYYTGVNDTGERSERLCLDISPGIIFPSQEGKQCPPKEGFKLIDFRKEIPQGYYELSNNTQISDIFPTICAYYKEE